MGRPARICLVYVCPFVFIRLAKCTVALKILACNAHIRNIFSDFLGSADCEGNSCWPPFISGKHKKYNIFSTFLGREDCLISSQANTTNKICFLNSFKDKTERVIHAAFLSSQANTRNKTSCLISLEEKTAEVVYAAFLPSLTNTTNEISFSDFLERGDRKCI